MTARPNDDDDTRTPDKPADKPADESAAPRPRRRRRWIRRAVVVIGVLMLLSVSGGLIFVRSAAAVDLLVGGARSDHLRQQRHQ